MALKSGSMSWRSFQIQEGSSCLSLNRQEILEGLDGTAFRDPDVDAGETESEGFVVHDEILNTDFEAASEQTFVGSYMIVTYRRDRLRIPSAYLKALVEAEISNIQARTGKDFVGRAQKTAVREEIQRMLLKRALPAVQKAEVLWAFDSNIVRVFAGSAGLAEAACSAFEEAFDARLLPLEPFTRLLDHGWSEEKLEKSVPPAPLFVPALIEKTP